MSAVALTLAGTVLGLVKEELGCSVETVQVSTNANGWMEIVIADDRFGGSFDARLLGGVICAGLSHKLRYAGSVTHEGGTVTITIARAEDGMGELRVSEGW